ncbi:MAG: arsenate reductase (glutaredoxin) [Hyphomicrobiaceae bacterium]
MPAQSKPSEIVIYHNPKCGSSRKTLELLRERGIEPRVVEYLKTPPDRQTLRALAKRMGTGLSALLREKGTPYAELDLGRKGITDDEILDAMEQHPILLNRPVVVTSLGARVCRPPETVLEILPKAE